MQKKIDRRTLHPGGRREYEKGFEYGKLYSCLQNIKIALELNNKVHDKILKILDGNGETGLKTQVALNKSSIKRSWWWLGAISVSLLSLGGALIIMMLKIKIP